MKLNRQTKRHHMNHHDVYIQLSLRFESRLFDETDKRSYKTLFADFNKEWQMILKNRGYKGILNMYFEKQYAPLV